MARDVNFSGIAEPANNKKGKQDYELILNLPVNFENVNESDRNLEDQRREDPGLPEREERRETPKLPVVGEDERIGGQNLPAIPVGREEDLLDSTTMWIQKMYISETYL